MISIQSSARRTIRFFALGFVVLSASFLTPATASEPPATPLFQKGDRIAWVGSSSTKIGVWPDTVEFLLRTRYPNLDLKFERFTTGGGDFATGLEHLDEWLKDFRPTVVVFNYGANDAEAGRKGLTQYKENMERCVVKAREKGARVLLVPPQAADPRKAGVEATARRALYAETMLSVGRLQGWNVIDIHHPLAALQLASEKDDPAYTILKDKIHLTDPAYVAWGFYFYDRLDLPFVRDDATLTASGKIEAEENCKIEDVKSTEESLSFTRADEVLPILPPDPLPPRLSVPLEAHSRYLLTITGLTPGKHEIRCEGQTIGSVDADDLAAGMNLNTILMDERQPAPWSALAKSIRAGKSLDQIGRTRWRFEIRK